MGRKTICTNYEAPHYVIIFMPLFTSSPLSQNILMSLGYTAAAARVRTGVNADE
jgi:hypothetical protein